VMLFLKVLRNSDFSFSYVFCILVVFVFFENHANNYGRPELDVCKLAEYS
jgi:hypothetical protein